MNGREGFLVAFEGLDGCGKDSQIKELCKFLEGNNIKYKVVNQLETEVGQIIRKKYLSGEVKVDEKVIDLLFASDRLEYLTSIVSKYLNDDYIVILNRYLLSALAYACYKTSLLSFDESCFVHDKLYYDYIKSINNMAFTAFWPDVTFFLNISPNTSISRVNGRGNSKEIYEDPRKQKYIYHLFQSSVQAENSITNHPTIITIDGERSIEEISADVRNTFMTIIPEAKLTAAKIVKE